MTQIRSADTDSRPARPSRKIGLSLSHAHSHGALSFLEMGKPDGPCLVFLHGFGADLLTWQFCLVPLANRFRLLALDLPAHGRSAPSAGTGTLDFMTGWLDEALDVLEVEAAHLIGHSMGGKIALAYGLGHAERVLSLSLLCPAGIGSAFHHLSLDGFLATGEVTTATALAHQLLGPRGQSLSAGVAKSLVTAVSSPDRVQALRLLLSQARSDGDLLSTHGFDWSQVRCPLQILWGDSDRFIPLPHALKLPKTGRVHIIKGAGHLPQMEAPDQVLIHLKEFLSL